MELRPSMRCVGNITLDQVEDALSVPIQSIFREGRSAFVYVPTSGGFAQQKVTLGRASELSVEIINGIEKGDQVLLREPQPIEIVSRLPIEGKQPDSESDGGNTTTVKSESSDQAAQKTASNSVDTPDTVTQ